MLGHERSVDVKSPHDGHDGRFERTKIDVAPGGANDGTVEPERHRQRKDVLVHSGIVKIRSRQSWTPRLDDVSKPVESFKIVVTGGLGS